MSTKYVITDVGNNTFAACFHNDRCVQLQMADNQNIAGNIYIGRVENVVKNIDSAFIEIQKGTKCYYPIADNKRHLFLNRKNNNAVNQGDFILIQIVKEAAKTKPATASSKLTFSGNYVVLSTDVNGVTVSNKIKKDINSKQLSQLLEQQFTFNVFDEDDRLDDKQRQIGDYGFILRSNSVVADSNDVLAEAAQLVSTFKCIVKKALYSKPLVKLFNAAPEYLNSLRHIPSDELDEVVTDLPEIYDFLKKTLPASKIRLYDDKMLSLSKLYSLENELECALKKKIWLKCGGYIIIEQTEALTVIDVNSGKYISKKGSPEAKESTISRVNTEAAKEIAIQLRLRNLSGIIIVDFINMKNDYNNSELLSYLRNLFKEDAQTTTVVDITKLGLVEITRKREGKSLKEQIMNDSIAAAGSVYG